MTDSGWTSISRDRGTASQKIDQKYGVVCDINGNKIDNLVLSATNQEHGTVSDRHELNWDCNKFHIGDMLRILPNHACATGAMHDKYYVVDGSNEVIDVWSRINGW
jgi:D-serine deaminase-like pyridoxal phosphate-dependent protein